MNNLHINLLGFPSANRDLTVELRDPASNKVVREVKPFLDGTVHLPRIAPGAYEVTVKHPNLALPVLRRPIRVLPGGDTKISVLIDPSQFRNTPIEDIPEANLGPVTQMSQSIAETVLHLSQKQAGEAIKAEDWNAMASGLRDLALAVAELTRLVTPTGHDHPEFNRKFDEVTGNFTALLNTLAAAMTELQRQIQSQRFRQQVETVLDDAGADEPTRKEFRDIVGTLEKHIAAPPPTFSRAARDAGVQLETKLSELIDKKKDAKPDLVNSNKITNLARSVDLLKSQRATDYSAELEHLRRQDRTGGSRAGLISILQERK